MFINAGWYNKIYINATKNRKTMPFFAIQETWSKEVSRKKANKWKAGRSTYIKMIQMSQTHNMCDIFLYFCIAKLQSSNSNNNSDSSHRHRLSVVVYIFLNRRYYIYSKKSLRFLNALRNRNISLFTPKGNRVCVHSCMYSLLVCMYWRVVDVSNENNTKCYKLCIVVSVWICVCLWVWVSEWV